MIRSADVSDDWLYRYSLRRKWAEGMAMGFIMLNPSTADAEIDDPTIRRCIGYAKREGCGSIHVVNVFAFRTSSPKVLKDSHAMGLNIKGERNTFALYKMLTHTDYVVAAWGGNITALARDPKIDSWVSEIKNAMTHDLCRGRCLGKTVAGEPRHPLYLKSDAPLVRFP